MLNLIDLIENNVQDDGDADIFHSRGESLRIIKKHFNRAKKDGEAIAVMDFSVGDLVYVAQKITGFDTANSSSGYWLNKVKILNDRINQKYIERGEPDSQVFLLDPWQFNLSRICGKEPGTLEPCVDYALVSASTALMMDYVRGVSFGSTCEILCANSRETPVIGVRKSPAQHLSVFTERHTQYWRDARQLVEHVKCVHDKVVKDMKPRLRDEKVNWLGQILTSEK